MIFVNSKVLKLLEVSKIHHVYVTENNAIAVFCTVDLLIFKADFVALTP